MAKLKGPLFSLGASQKLGDALVFFGWKGLNVVREYVVPSNPKTSGQTTQRGYLSLAVEKIHYAQAQAAMPLAETDTMALALWGSTFPTPRTWFNQQVKNVVDQLVAGKEWIIARGATVTPGANTLTLKMHCLLSAANPTTGNIHYGTSKTALIHTQAATFAQIFAGVAIAGLTTGTKYYMQWRPTVPVGYVGAMSGIYYGTPT